MLETVEVRTPQGTLLTLVLEDIENGLVVQKIEGLDPVKATLVSSSFAQQDGAYYQASRRETRNIKFELGLEPDYLTNTVRSLRDDLYRFFMPKKEVQLRFIHEDDFTVDIVGRVETFESELFTDEPKVDISLLCFDPDFKDPASTVLSGETVASTTELYIPYEGTVDTGIKLTLNVDRTLTDFSLYHRAPDDTTHTIDFSAPLDAGDVLVISTVPGAKGATLTRSGIGSSALYGVSPQSIWTSLEQGDNFIRVYAEGAAIPYEIEYTAKYGGL